jgi:hypothetical protein
MAIALALPEDVWAYDPDISSSDVKNVLATASRWVLHYAPSLRFAVEVPTPAREAAALLAAVFASDREATTTPARVPNMVRTMLWPWLG